MRKNVSAFLLFTGYFLIWTKPVHAYIDPATTTYLIQILSALVITLGVTVGVFFGRIRQFFLNFRVRMTELRIRVFEQKRDDKQPQKNEKHEISLPFIKRFLLALPTSVALFFTLVIFGVYELYMNNQEAFMFPLTSVLLSLILIALLGTLLLALLIAVFRHHTFSTVLSIAFGLLLAFNLEGNLLNLSLGELTGDSIPWELYRTEAIVNLFVWIVLIGLVVVIGHYLKNFWKVLVRLAPAVILMAQIIAMIVISATAAPSTLEDNLYLSRQGIYEVGKKENIVVIVLDRLDNWFINDVLKEEPDFFDRMDGFTRFTNNISLYSQTFPSVANMLTGERYDFNDYWADYLENAWKTGDFIPRLKGAGYENRFYMERSYAYRDAQDLLGLADNIVEGKISIDRKEAVGQFMGLSSYRYVPLVLKPFFWTSTEAFGKIIDVSLETAPYITDDLAFFKGLKEERLKIGEAEKNFLFIHLNGPHPPYNLDEYGNEAEPGQSSYKIQTKGSFRIVFEYLDQLKALGLYEDATIIVTGDHGARLSDTQPLSSAIVTGLFVKPKGAIGEPIKINRAPLTSDNLRATVIEAAGIDAPQYGQSYFEVSPDEFAVRFLFHRLYGSEDQPARVEVYQVLGDANQFNNWILVEEEIIR